jgi:hypothetical protein
MTVHNELDLALVELVATSSCEMSLMDNWIAQLGRDYCPRDSSTLRFVWH